MLQASPSPLSSVSVCSGLLSNGQLSQRSPTPSLSESNCRGLYTSGQLSCAKHIHTQTHTGDVNIQLFSVKVCSQSFSQPQSHPLICDIIIVIIRITGVSLSVLVQVFLSRVWDHGTIILQAITTWHQIQSEHILLIIRPTPIAIFNVFVLVCSIFYLLTVVGCILFAGQFVVGPAIQIRVFTTQGAITRKAHAAQTFVQDLGC